MKKLVLLLLLLFIPATVGILHASTIDFQPLDDSKQYRIALNKV